jgi:hypothetical protein
MSKFFRIIGLLFILLFLGVLVFMPLKWAVAGDKELEDMQKQLNSQVLEKPFSVEDSQKIDAYIKDSMQKNMKPNGKIPGGWQPGYTCANLHDYYEYRDCLYYYRYYGHYYP